jgi:hypothetical protein
MQLISLQEICPFCYLRSIVHELKLMNGGWWGTTTVENIAHRLSAHIGTTWPDVMGLLPPYREKGQKSTCAGKSLQGVKWKMGTVFAHDCFYGFLDITMD